MNSTASTPSFRRTSVLGLALLVGGVLLMLVVSSETSAGRKGGSVLFSACFHGVEDGPGDGESFPAEFGTMVTVVGNGAPFDHVAPQSGIWDERLYLTDEGGFDDVDFGVVCATEKLSPQKTIVRFEIELAHRGTSFIADITDTSGMDISRLEFLPDGSIMVNGFPGATVATAKVPYEVEFLLSPGEGRKKDRYLVTVMEVETGAVIGTWSGELEDGFRPVAYLSLQKSGQSPGDLFLDDIEVLEAQD